MGLTNLPPGNAGPHSEPGASAVSQAVPAYAAWYVPGAVHDVERRALPELLVSRKAEEAYVAVRDHMVSAYRARPHEYLSLTAVRRAIGGDVSTLMRVHSFLEQWGLVNYQVAGAAPGTAAVGVVPGTVATGRRPVVPTVAAETPASAAVAAMAAAAAAGGAHPLDVFLRAPPASAAVVCASCAAECPRVYYAVDGAPSDAAVCPACYAAGALPSGRSSDDYARVDSARSDEPQPWTPEETLALLEAIDGDAPDWDEVARRVGRPRDQCVLRFVSLPTEECVAAAGDAPSASGAHGVPSKLGDALPASLPFAEGENPVVATLAFLAGAVHPRVAAAAARAAVCEVASHMDAASRAADSLIGDSGPEDSGAEDAAIAPEGRHTAQAAAAALACAAARAAELAADEARRAAALRAQLLDLHLARLRAKMALYEDLEKTLEDDRRDLEQQRLALFFERFNLRKQMMALDSGGSSESGTHSLASL